MTCDITSDDDVKKLDIEMRSRNFDPDAVILSAGIFDNDINPDFDVGTSKRVFNTNLWGLLAVISLILPRFIKKTNGHVIALSSISSFRPNEKGVAYPASKAALALMMRGLDAHYRKYNVAFTTVYLGPIATRMWEGSAGFMAPHPETIAPKIEKLLITRPHVSYMPFFSTFLSRILCVFPDSWYMKLSRIIKK